MDIVYVAAIVIIAAIGIVVSLKVIMGKPINDPAALAALQQTIADKVTALAVAEARLAEGEKVIERLTGELAYEKASIASWQSRCAGIQSDNAALHEQIVQITKQSDEKLQLLIEARDSMAQEFKVLATDIVQQHGVAFSKQSTDQIGVLLSPLQQRMSEFAQGLQVTHVETERERAALKAEIKMFADTSLLMSTETRNLTRALKGDGKTQGVWGEMTLSTILEKSGLRKGEDYNAQETCQTDTGRVRPDVIVNLPYDNRVVIDSKVSLTAFERFINSVEDAERAEHLQQHVESMRSHIKTLGSKAYWSIEGCKVDYVIMFLPIEGALRAALEGDADLLSFAIEQNVTIATPTTLIIALRTVASMWKIERQNRNVVEIADRAGKLYDKFVGFVDEMTEIGKYLDRAKESYTGAFAKLNQGKGNLVWQVETLKKLGARSNGKRSLSDFDDDAAGPETC